MKKRRIFPNAEKLCKTASCLIGYVTKKNGFERYIKREPGGCRALCFAGTGRFALSFCAGEGRAFCSLNDDGDDDGDDDALRVRYERGNAPRGSARPPFQARALRDRCRALAAPRAHVP